MSAVRSPLGLITGAVVAIAIIALLTVAVWPASASDRAREDGERLGEAVRDLSEAETYGEVDEALTDVREAAREARIHAGDELGEQITEQSDALAHAANGFAGAVTTTDEWEADVYEAELDAALDDLAAQAEAFRAEAPEVEQAFWDGFDEGLES